MKKVGLALLILILITISCKTKSIVVEKSSKKETNYIPYYLKVYEADSLFLVNDFERCFKILDSVFKIYKPLNMEGWYEYSVYLSSAVMSGHTNNIDEKVKYGFLNFGGISSFHPQSFILESKVITASGLSKQEIEALKKKYLEKLNLTLRNKIIKMKKEDQYVRIEKYSDTGMVFFSKKHNTELINIFKQYGYPNHLLVGSDNYFEDSADIKTILMHQIQNESVVKELLPLLLNYVELGVCDPSVYAAVYDKEMWQKKDLQFYGTFPNNEKNIYNYPSLINPSKIDSTRKTIGLPSLKYNDWRNAKMEEAN